ncbi:hypothetical protein C5F59_038050 [Streptomyces sp. QL37]|uniref:hypothetical protein n=1 Tax=Streptomyces sp. QL37 TaxID=2093747 RepID=UPI0035C10BE7
MTTRNSEPSPGPGNNGGEGADWEDEFGFDDRQFVVEDLTDTPEPLPPAVTGAPPAPAPAAEPPGEPSAQ